MSNQLAEVRALDVRPQNGPVHRSIVAVDLEGSTKRTNLVKGELRRILYDLLDRALKAAGIGNKHLEQLTDRGDGVLILVRPHDDVPKTVLLAQLIPVLPLRRWPSPESMRRRGGQRPKNLPTVSEREAPRSGRG